MRIYVPAHVAVELETGKRPYQRKHESGHIVAERMRKAETKRRRRRLAGTR